MRSIRRPHDAAVLRLVAAAALLVVPTARAHAQFGGLMKKAKQAVAEKTAEKAVDRAAEHAGVGPTAAGGGTVTESLVQKILDYDAAQVTEYNRIVSTDARFRSYNASRAEYERCYARNLVHEKSVRRYTRLAEQARIDAKMDAYAKWSDSLNTTRMAQLRAAPTGCTIPEMGSALADAASEGAHKAAAAKTGINARELGTMTERLTAYLHLSPSERKTAVAKGAYRAEEAAAMDGHLAGLQTWMSHGSGIDGGEADPQAVASYRAEMERYTAASESHHQCLAAAGQAGGTPDVPASMQAQIANMKEPTPEQQREVERLGKLGEAAANRNDAAKARIYADSIQLVMGIRMNPRAQADGQKYAREVMDAQKKTEAAQRKCGIAPEEPIKPAYVR